MTDPTATTYQVAGIVTDAESNAVMDGVTVTNVTNSKSMTTAADGKYVLEAKVGETNVVTFAKSGYKTVTSSVFVTKQAHRFPHQIQNLQFDILHLLSVLFFCLFPF